MAGQNCSLEKYIRNGECSWTGCLLLFSIASIFSLVTLNADAEEIGLRGIVYTRIEKNLKPVIAVIISAVLFGLMHLMAGGIILVLGAMIMGLALGLLLYKYNSLWICIIAHICANIPDFIYSKERFTSTGLRIGLITVFSIAALASLVWIFKGNRVTQKSS